MREKIHHTFELVKFSHSVFALPFALAAYLVATQGQLRFWPLLWIIIAVVAARTAAMAFNRLADAKMDAQNPRTQNRHLPQGLLSQTYVLGLTLLSAGVFIFAASRLNGLAFALSPFCLAILLGYSFTKRFTHFTQFFLGLSLGMAPIGATIGALGRITLSSLVLGSAVLCWVAGFDLLYALQDFAFDSKAGVFSLPVKLGIKNTFLLAKILHAAFFLILLYYGFLTNMGLFYWLGLGISAGFLLWQHWLLRNDLTKINVSFFTANGLLSIFFLLFVALDIYIG